MKYILLSTAAIAGLAMAATASSAQANEPALQLGLAGYAAGYAVYSGGDLPSNSRKFDFRKHSEIYFTGEVALDNGITAGAHFEMLADRSDNEYGNTRMQESYLYLSSSWGRINFGEEDGVAYLLQVAAPSADSNVDGLRPIISTIGSFGYAQDPFGYENKFTYITPMFNGFQAGISYAPTLDVDLDGLAPVQFNRTPNEHENGLEIAARYEGSFDAIDLAIGAGYSHASLETKAGSNLNAGSIKAWNVGANIGYDAFGFGAAYLRNNNGTRRHGDYRSWVAGVDYETGPYKLGLSYLNGKQEMGVANSFKVQQWTAGGIYEWGPGMTFRGAVQYIDGKQTGTSSHDAVQVLLGTQFNF